MASCYRARLRWSLADPRLQQPARSSARSRSTSGAVPTTSLPPEESRSSSPPTAPCPTTSRRSSPASRRERRSSSPPTATRSAPSSSPSRALVARRLSTLSSLLVSPSSTSLMLPARSSPRRSLVSSVGSHFSLASVADSVPPSPSLSRRALIALPLRLASLFPFSSLLFSPFSLRRAPRYKHDDFTTCVFICYFRGTIYSYENT